MYTWDPRHEAACRKVFYTKAGSILKKALYDMREERTKSGFVFMGEANLAKMQVKWASPEWQKKSKAGQDARTSTVGEAEPCIPAVVYRRRFTRAGL